MALKRLSYFFTFLLLTLFGCANVHAAIQVVYGGNLKDFNNKKKVFFNTITSQIINNFDEVIQIDADDKLVDCELNLGGELYSGLVALLPEVNGDFVLGSKQKKGLKNAPGSFYFNGSIDQILPPNNPQSYRIVGRFQGTRLPKISPYFSNLQPYHLETFGSKKDYCNIDTLVYIYKR